MKFKILILLVLSASSVNANVADSLSYGVFGKLKIYHPATSPKQLVLFVSGDGGWNQGVVDMAMNFVAMDAAVVGIDIRSYLKNLQKTKSACYYPAADFENLSKFIQKKYHYKNYTNPLLLGYSSGATLIYGILAQSPANTFSGAIALGFCPDLQIDKPLCTGSGLKVRPLGRDKGFYLEASTNFEEPFYVLQGTTDQVCDYKNTASFLKQIPKAKLISLDKVGHGFSVKKNWVPQMKMAYGEFAEGKSKQEIMDQEDRIESQIKELPVHIVPAAVTSEENPLVFFISGDGGYTSFDKSFCKELAARGMPVVSLDALKYFWNEKTPASTTADVEKLISLYKDKWQKNKVLLVGYSFGADALPFVYNTMNKNVRENVKMLALLSPAVEADFEIHIMDMLSLPGASKKYDVVSEIDKIKNLRTICIYGSEEEQEIKGKTANPNLNFLTIPGGHHYDNNFKALAEMIISQFRK